MPPAGLRYSQAVVNSGREAGASIEHPHGQLLSMPFIPGEAANELAGFARFQGNCLLCAVWTPRRRPSTAWCSATTAWP